VAIAHVVSELLLEDGGRLAVVLDVDFMEVSARDRQFWLELLGLMRERAAGIRKTHARERDVEATGELLQRHEERLE
jgi:hypothetical protein